MVAASRLRDAMVVLGKNQGVLDTNGPDGPVDSVPAQPRGKKSGSAKASQGSATMVRALERAGHGKFIAGS